MLRRLFCGVLAVLSSNVIAKGQAHMDGAYFCTVESLTVLWYNAPEKRWEGARFGSHEEFVLQLKHVRTTSEKWTDDIAENFEEYDATITTGKSIALPCRNEGKAARMDRYGFLNCASTLVEYRFDLTNNRFLSAHLVGSATGQDENANIRPVSRGTCARTD
jgi:hypothetical protein